MESQFLNLYFGLMFNPNGYPAITPFNKIREGTIPDFKVTQALNFRNGPMAITTPPPHVVSEFENASIPMPKGRRNLCYVRLAHLGQKQLVVKDEKDEGMSGSMEH